MTQSPRARSKDGMKKRDDTENLIVHCRKTYIQLIELTLDGLRGAKAAQRMADECAEWLDKHGHIHFYKSVKGSERKYCGCGASVTLEEQIEYIRTHRQRKRGTTS